MKRALIFLFIAITVPLMCVAANTKEGVYLKEIFIQGGYDTVASLSVEPIPVQSEGFLMGMPFPLDDPTAQFGANDRGRHIANWHVLTNNPFLLDINAEILHYDGDGDKASYYTHGLGYRLTFVYQLSYHSGNEVISPLKGFYIDVPQSRTTKTYDFKNIDLLHGVPMKENSLVGSASGKIYFSFDEQSSNLIDTDYTNINNVDYPEADRLPEGNYSATVKITLRVKESSNV